MEERRITRIPIDAIDRDETQPRKDFPEEELKEWAEENGYVSENE